MAYWTNAYNAFTLKLIVDNYPTKSILNFDGGKTWDVRRIKIGDKKYSLNNIETIFCGPSSKILAFTSRSTAPLKFAPRFGTMPILLKIWTLHWKTAPEIL